MLRRAARSTLALLALLLAGAEFVAPQPYAAQSREEVSAPPSSAHWLGTDHLGRDRWSRLVHGARLSAVLAPAAAAVTLVLALAVAIGAALAGGALRAATVTLIDLVLSLPWFFLLIAVRALLPLNTGPATSVAVLFLLLALLGWAAPARVLYAAAEQQLRTDHVLLARACGYGAWRLTLYHIAPNLLRLARAQFWTTAPAFLLAEANLSMLGLGVAEPLPSWGSLLRELQEISTLPREPWIAAPLALLVVALCCCQLGFREALPGGAGGEVSTDE
jgi:ABC-type dipeptide/oligopeptide/nickel transport system permease subunit